jgi:hypothetical protein
MPLGTARFSVERRPCLLILPDRAVYCRASAEGCTVIETEPEGEAAVRCAHSTRRHVDSLGCPLPVSELNLIPEPNHEPQAQICQPEAYPSFGPRRTFARRGRRQEPRAPGRWSPRQPVKAQADRWLLHPRNVNRTAHAGPAPRPQPPGADGQILQRRAAQVRRIPRIGSECLRRDAGPTTASERRRDFTPWGAPRL